MPYGLRNAHHESPQQIQQHLRVRRRLSLVVIIEEHVLLLRLLLDGVDLRNPLLQFFLFVEVVVAFPRLVVLPPLAGVAAVETDVPGLFAAGDALANPAGFLAGAMCMGEAAGTAAAMTAAASGDVHAVDTDELRSALKVHGAYLPDVDSQPPRA